MCDEFTVRICVALWFHLINATSRLMSPSAGVGLNMWLVCVLLLSPLSAVSGAADSKAVTTTLTTKWADTPLLLEARYVTPLRRGVAAFPLYYVQQCISDAHNKEISLMSPLSAGNEFKLELQITVIYLSIVSR